MMKRLIFSTILVLSSFALVFGAESRVWQDFDKIIQKEFPITKDGTFDVSNKYGNINIEEWSRDAIEVKVQIVVKTNSESKAEEVFDKIEIDFENSRDYVSAKTNLEKMSSSWWKGWGRANAKFEIHYDVKMPKSVHLKLSNKYGNSYLIDFENGAELYTAYGNLNAKSVSGTTQVELAYGEFNFGNLQEFSMEAKYSDIKGGSSGQTDIESKYSDIQIESVDKLDCETAYDEYKIDKVGSLDNEGKYDDFILGEVAEIDIESKYSDIIIDKLIYSADISQNYGSIEIKEVECREGEIEIESNYTDVMMDLDNCKNFDFEFRGEYTGVRVPDYFETNMDKKDGKSRHMESNMGNGAKQIEIEMKYGELKVY